MTSNEFIDRLELELRAASRRRLRLELARIPRVPPGVTLAVVTLAVCAAVAVPLLATRSRSLGVPGGGRQGGPPVTVSCGNTVSGQLPAGWRGAFLTPPITWVNLLQDTAHPRSIRVQHFVQVLAVVIPGREVTVSIPVRERHDLSLDFTSVSPRPRFYLSQGARAVTFRPCSGPAGQTQFNGGFIVSRAQCAVIDVRTAPNQPLTRYAIPLGRQCGGPVPAENVLKGNGIGQARFGEPPRTVTRRVDALLGQRPRRRGFGKGLCGIDGEIDWPGLAALFRHRRFVGYTYGPSTSDGGVSLLGTARELRVGETVREARRFYGSSFHVSSAQGGSWWVRTPSGVLDGYTSEVLSAQGRVETIEAGDVGCPAMTP